jgi:hypothetical protein
MLEAWVVTVGWHLPLVFIPEGVLRGPVLKRVPFGAMRVSSRAYRRSLSRTGSSRSRRVSTRGKIFEFTVCRGVAA